MKTRGRTQPYQININLPSTTSFSQKKFLFFLHAQNPRPLKIGMLVQKYVKRRICKKTRVRRALAQEVVRPVASMIGISNTFIIPNS